MYIKIKIEWYVLRHDTSHTLTQVSISCYIFNINLLFINYSEEVQKGYFTFSSHFQGYLSDYIKKWDRNGVKWMGQYTKKCHSQLKFGNPTISNTLNGKTTNIIKVLSSSISFVICNCFCNPTQKIALNYWMWYSTRITGNKKRIL